MDSLNQIGQQGKEAAVFLNNLESKNKNLVLQKMIDNLKKNTSKIIEVNNKDIEQAKSAGKTSAIIDRLLLTEDRIANMIESIETIIDLKDPIGNVDKMWQTDDNLLIGKKRVPIGVIGIIYEARPNVTVEAATLCFKAGNAVILRGGKDAFHSNKLLVSLMQEALASCGVPKHAIQYIEDVSHETAVKLMTLNEYLDLLIPRGGANLIQTVVKNATVPVIETGTGNCHLYIDKEADHAKAVEILINGKCQRPSVCNALETLIIHQDVAKVLLPVIEKRLAEFNVEIRADENAGQYLKNWIPATDEDYATEFLDYILAIKTVNSLEEALKHIQTYSSKHSEVIVSENYSATQAFLQQVDAAAVYANASTRFTDGSMFGFGGEIGISTQKLHARGPMGLEELTSIKYIIYGDGQIRN
ncbi:glutamate-5-semialdehyde dehydrogenase [Vagococcus elongatus]|uniref:Gamma-glutamyl phosphate reductase n=1 Tax=Vagococcus elongatus TaxID=180344 RepID=A0A430AUZ8_9ENTE|nr:glutamate-5-semialdehyde dehydrogenase [Vagococcus elongatus]RSU11882.1 glutamate-5-semialdehyde dehydrogenase [Vagococcus elongatus]